MNTRQQKNTKPTNRSEIKLSNEARKQEIVTLEDDTQQKKRNREERKQRLCINERQHVSSSVFFIRVCYGRQTNTQKSMGKTIIAFLTKPNH